LLEQGTHQEQYIVKVVTKTHMILTLQYPNSFAFFAIDLHYVEKYMNNQGILKKTKIAKS
jgi:hypothetical protein